MKNKQALLTALLVTSMLNTTVYTTETGSTKNAMVVVSEAITKKDLEKLATKNDVNKLINPVKRIKWFTLGALFGAGATCVLRAHKDEIEADLNQKLGQLIVYLKKLSADLRSELKNTQATLPNKENNQDKPE